MTNRNEWITVRGVVESALPITIAGLAVAGAVFGARAAFDAIHQANEDRKWELEQVYPDSQSALRGWTAGSRKRRYWDEGAIANRVQEMVLYRLASELERFSEIARKVNQERDGDATS